MTSLPANIHGTAIVVGGTGFIFVGPSGSGKSALAFSCLAESRALGLPAALVADDRVLISKKDGEVAAACPASTAGLIEVRGTGILRLAHVSPAILRFAVLLVDLSGAQRLPEENERIEVAAGIDLPLMRIASNARNPLAIIMAKMAECFD
jgi:serine kinase of HPr protein (carbohydrate metabolism regulator)